MSFTVTFSGSIVLGDRSRRIERFFRLLFRIRSRAFRSSSLSGLPFFSLLSTSTPVTEISTGSEPVPPRILIGAAAAAASVEPKGSCAEGPDVMTWPPVEETTAAPWEGVNPTEGMVAPGAAGMPGVAGASE
eukprot:CAMPEP_0170197538 /NCGR_PEP_ID=MMETSP0040_2-20121228/66625_1 /TAXON_ID=641309 /ORGANISM="Lotharella oceanica, Strain CCMP622" /LENGTH=131 /DNA_ID=CAMNT_0010447231 /DNA_START=386 /DNA_END=781 /DNA_ORIENTATION=+